MGNPNDLGINYGWPDYLMRDFQLCIREMRDLLEVNPGDQLIGGASWKPWELLTNDQAIWMLARIYDLWPKSGFTPSTLTAWDEGGAAEVWCNLCWESSTPNPPEWTQLAVKSLRRCLRERGDQPPKAFYVNDGGTYGDEEALNELRDMALENLFFDMDYDFLDIGPESTIKSLDAAICGGLHIPTGYFRCPIPRNLDEAEISRAHAVIDGPMIELKTPRKRSPRK